jgi:hypothetical protein
MFPKDALTKNGVSGTPGQPVAIASSTSRLDVGLCTPETPRNAAKAKEQSSTLSSELSTVDSNHQPLDVP